MKSIIIFYATAILILSSGSALADMTVIDFESLNNGILVDNQFTGLGADFNGDATAIYVPSSSLTPPHSGSKVIFNYPSYDIRIDAVGPEWLMVGGYVTGADIVTLTAYDSSDTPLGTDSTVGANIVGSGTPNIFLSINAPNIAYAEFSIYNGYTFTVDDLTFVQVPVPTAVLLGMLGLSVAGMKLRKFV